MLAAADGSGQCGAWAQFLIDMFKAHGITTADRVEVVRSIPERNNVGFLVKNWNFNTPPATSANSFTHLDAQMTKMPGIPGQSNPNPPPAFFNHFIVVYNLALYDPSYGAGPFNNQLLSWEDAAIDGLFQSLPRMNGYNRVLVTLAMLPNLLELWNLRTHTRI
jgi:hypothetical protein